MGQLVGLTSIHHRMTCNDPVAACAATGPNTWASLRDATYFQSAHNAGYFTSHVGKLVNWYPCPTEVSKSGQYSIPSAIDDFHTLYRGNIAFDGGYATVDRSFTTPSRSYGVKSTHPRVALSDSDYGTYVLRDLTLAAVDRCAVIARPCLMTYMSSAGHRPGDLPLDYKASTDVAAPAHYPSFNEGCPATKANGGALIDPSIADKPSFSQAPSAIRCFGYTATTWSRNTDQGTLQAEDTSLDAIIARLQADGLYDSTVIIFTTDHGFSDNENNHISKEVPYDTNMRIPLLMRVPGAPTQTISHLAYLPDIYPTILDISGAPPLVAGAAADSRSLMDLVRNPAVATHPYGILGSHLQDTVDPALDDTRPWTALYPDCAAPPSPCRVLINYPSTNEYELYDLATDPFEIHQILPNPLTGYAGLVDPLSPTVAGLETTLALRTFQGS
jgi:arylsulfatase A-like enzyme